MDQQGQLKIHQNEERTVFPCTFISYFSVSETRNMATGRRRPPGLDLLCRQKGPA